MTVGRRKIAFLGLAGVGAAVVALAVVRRIDGNAEQRRETARVALEAGRFATARSVLEPLVARRPDDGEAWFLLGLSEQGLGRADRAEAAWLRVGPGDPAAGLALLHRARLEQANGRLGPTEDLLLQAIEAPGEHRPIARWDLVRLLRLEGRHDEARDLFRAGIAEHPDPADALRVLYKLETEAYPAASAAAQFEQAGRLAPEDDRIWLGRAFVAMQAGRFEEADGWLKRCEAARPGDSAVARMRLDWGIAADRPDVVEAALRTVPARASKEDERHALEIASYLAASAGDEAAERKILVRLDTEDASAHVLDRLAQAAFREGRADEAAAYRQRRLAREADREAYVAAISRPFPRDRGAELAARARAFGRPWEFEAWTALAETRPGGEEERERLARVAVLGARIPGRTLESWVRPHLAAVDWDAVGRGTVQEVGRIASPAFADAGTATGLAAFVHRSGHVEGRLTLPETGAGGVALLDFDGDRRLDVYAVQSGAFPPGADARSADRLFRNRGDGTFEDVSERTGITSARGGYGHGVAVGDIDGDGRPDLFLTRWRAYQLLRNRGDGGFDDVTEEWGLAGDRDWPTSAAFADLDADGDLDLYVCHYLKWDELNDRTCVDPKNPSSYSCIPLDFEARPDRLFRNDGGEFVDVTSEAGIDDRDGRGLGVVATDCDGDGRVDLFVANDMTANFLWRNLGGMRFEEVGMAAGVACNAMGGYQAGMGVAAGDLDGDALVDLAVTNYYNESTSFFKSLGDGNFVDRTAAIGLAAPSRDRLGFGLALPDVDNDGRLDLISANGHVHDGRPDYPWKMRPQLLLGTPSGRLLDATDEAGPPFQREVLGRGLTVGDLDDDGRIDAVILAQDEPLQVMRNETEAGAWVRFRLVGVESNRDAVGAVVTIEVGGRTQVASRFGGGSFQSASDPRIHFGLGDSERVDRVEVRWPSGRVEMFGAVEAGRTYQLRDGSGRAEIEFTR